MASKKSRVDSIPATAPAKAPSIPARAEKIDQMAVAPSSTAGVTTAKAPTAETQPAAATGTAVAVAAAPVAAAKPAAPVVTATPAAPVAHADKPRDRTSIIALIARLHDPDAEVARDAAAALGRLPADREAVDALRAILINANGYFHSVVRAAAAAALGLLGDRSAVDALIHATGDTMAEASEEAIKSLGLLADRRALPALAAVVRNDHGFYIEPVRRAAQDAQRRIEGAKA